MDAGRLAPPADLQMAAIPRYPAVTRDISLLLRKDIDLGLNAGKALRVPMPLDSIVVEQDRRRYLTVEQELEHAVQYGDATELWVLERAISVYWALYWRIRYGGYPFGDKLLSKGTGAAWIPGRRVNTLGTPYTQTTADIPHEQR